MNRKTSTYLFLIFVIVFFLLPYCAKATVLLICKNPAYWNGSVLLKPGAWCAGYSDPNDPRNMDIFCTTACQNGGYPRGGYGQCIQAYCACGFRQVNCCIGSVCSYNECWYDVYYSESDNSCVYCYCYENTPPGVSTEKADVSVPNKSAALKGTITDNGGQNADLRGFDWGTSSGSYPNSWTEGTSGNYQYGTGAFSYNLTGLDPNIVYYYRAKAHNSKGWGYGIEMTLFAPIVSTQPATNIQAYQANLNGNLSDLGGVVSINIWFQWGLTTAYGDTTPSQVMSATGAFSAVITGLTPNMTTYHFRAVVQDSVGKTSYGGDLSFATPYRSPSGSGSYLYCPGTFYNIIAGGCSDAFCNNLCKASGYTGGYPTRCWSGCDYTCYTKICSIGGQNYTFCWCPNRYAGTAVAQCWCITAVNPTVTAQTATVDVQNNQATLRGNITATGGQKADLRGFEWGTSAGSYPNSWTEGTSGNYQYATGTFSYTLSGLTPGTIYYYRAKAHNSADWGYGSERKVVIYEASGGQKQFTTLPSDTTPPTTKIKIIRTSTGEDVTAAGTWLRADNYTVQFEDEDPEPNLSGLKSCEYYVYDVQTSTYVVSFTPRTCGNWSFNITAGTPPYDKEGAGVYLIYTLVIDNADLSNDAQIGLNFDFTPPETRIE